MNGSNWITRLSVGAKVLAWNIGFILVVCIINEAIFGSWFRAPNLWSLSIYRNIDWTFLVNKRYPSNDTIINYKRDYFGLRGDYGETRNINIITLGGSTTDERFVTEGKTWTDILGACLRRTGLPVVTANAGITGQTTRGHAKNFDVWLNHIPELAPKYAIAYFGVNERGVHALADKDDVRDFNESDRPISRVKILRKWIYMNSAIYAGWVVIRGNLEAFRLGFGSFRRKDFEQRFFPSSGTQETFSTDYYNALYAQQSTKSISIASANFRERVDVQKKHDSKKLSAFRERLKKLQHKITDFGSIPVFVTQSWSHYRIKDGMVSGDLKLYFTARAENETVIEFCRKNNVQCINLGEELKFQNNDFWDSVHTTPQGSKRIGEFICKRLLKWSEFSLK